MLGTEHLRYATGFIRVVKVAHDYYLRSAANGKERVAQTSEHTVCIEAIPLAMLLATVARGEMADEDIESIRRDDAPPNVEYVTRLLKSASGECHAVLTVTEVGKHIAAVEQGIVDAATVCAVCHSISVGVISQRRAGEKMLYDGVVFNLAECHERGHVPLACRRYHPRYLRHLTHVASHIPMAVSVGEKLVVVTFGVVLSVEKVFCVIAHDAEEALRRGSASQKKKKANEISEGVGHGNVGMS